MLDRWIPLAFEKCDDSIDLDELNSHELDNVLHLKWLCLELPPNYTDSFVPIRLQFWIQFLINRSHHLMSLTLTNIRQEKEESLCVFMEHFGMTTRHIRNLNHKVSLHDMITTLRPGSSVDSLCMRSTVNMDELRERAIEFMWVEDIRDFCRQMKHDASTSEKKKERKPNEKRDDSQPKELPKELRFKSSLTRILDVYWWVSKTKKLFI